MYTRITSNLMGAQIRREMRGGKVQMVVPTVMMTPGVHVGSQGPLLYLPDELAKFPESWNYRPATKDHPMLNGQGVSAGDPKILEDNKLGDVFNAQYDGRLKNETWFEEDSLRSKAPEVFSALSKGEMVEVSTGLFHDLEQTSGEWNGERYIGIVRNIRPDHLAILTKEVGACSIADGAGLLRNAATTEVPGPSFDEIRDQIRSLLREGKVNLDYCYVCDVYPKFAIYECKDKSFKIGYKLKSGKVSLDGEPEEVRKVTSYVTANGGKPVINEDMQGPLRSLPKPHIGELSEPMRKQQMQAALEKKYAGVQQEGDWGGWVTDLFANFVVWSKDGKLFRLPYTYDDDKINFGTDPEEEVERVSEYRTKRNVPIDGTSSSAYNVNSQGNGMATQAQINTILQLAELAKTNPSALTNNVIHKGAHELIHDPATGGQAHQPPEKSDGEVRSTAAGARKEEVNKMISGGGSWGEEDRKFLEGLPDDHFKRVQSATLKGATQPIVPYSYAGIGDRSNAPGATGNTQQAQPMTTDQYIAQAPPGVREMLLAGMTTFNAKREQLVLAIVNNKQGLAFNPDWLRTQAMPLLESMAAMAGADLRPTPTANYGGQAEVPMFLHNAANNDPRQAPALQVLQMPSMGIDKPQKATA